MNEQIFKALIYAGPPTAAVLVSWWGIHKKVAGDNEISTKKIQEIHVLVNSRLTEALEQIRELKDKYGDHT